MRKATIFYDDVIAGELTETNEGYFRFQYNEKYISKHPKDCIAFSMPVRSMPYTDKRLFPFFEGLIPEGWLLNFATKNWKLNRDDRMGLLLACCRNCIGAVSFEPINTVDEV